MYPAYLQVTDIAGLIRGASQGEGLGNAFLSHIQAVDGLFHVVRAFDNDEVLHVDDSIDPVRDLSKSLLFPPSYCDFCGTKGQEEQEIVVGLTHWCSGRHYSK